MIGKVCTKCGIQKPWDCFYKYKNRNGYRPDCRECGNSWAREYGKKDDVKKRRNQKGDKCARKNLQSWEGYIPKETGCQVCGTKIIFSSKDTNTSIHFDHKNEYCLIKIDPGKWLRRHKFTEENKQIWDRCDFGMLCGKCNRALPTKDRELWVGNVINYVWTKFGVVQDENII